MNWKSGLLVFLALAVVGGVAWMFGENRALFESPLAVAPAVLPGQDEPFEIPVGTALLGAFALGAGIVAAGWARERVRRAVAAVGERRESRARSGLDATYRRALEAIVDGRNERAGELLRDVLSADPDHGGALMAQADLLRAVGRPGDAVELRERRLESAPDDFAALHALASDHRARGDLRLAAATLERIVRQHPKRGLTAARRLREVLIEAGDYERAVAAHERVQKLGAAPEGEDPESFRVGLETRQALELSHGGRHREALALLRKVLRRRPDFVPAVLASAEVHVAEGREEEALGAWLDGYERTFDPSILVAAEAHHVAHRHEGDEVERAHAALTTFQRFVAVSQGAPHARAFLGKLYTRFEMLDEAAREFDAVRAEFPENPTFTYYAARIAEKRGRHEAAAGWYRGIIKALDVLRLRWRCSACDVEAGRATDRCPSCSRWGTVTLDIGVPPLARALPAAQPIYVVDDPAERREALAEAGEDASRD